MNKVLVVAVHPDDETLGAGGTLYWHQNNGDEIHWLIVTSMYAHEQDGILHTVDSEQEDVFLPSHFRFPSAAPLYPNVKVRKRALELKKVKECYSFNSVIQLHVPAATVADQDECALVSQVSDAILRVKPTTIYLPFHGDIHGDHRAIFEVLQACIKSFRYPFIKNVFMMEVLSETEFAPPLPGRQFSPNRFVCIDRFFEKKIDTFKIFESEIGGHPMPRNIEAIKAQARMRGALAQCDYAEAFVVLREIL